MYKFIDLYIYIFGKYLFSRVNLDFIGKKLPIIGTYSTPPPLTGCYTRSFFKQV